RWTRAPAPAPSAPPAGTPRGAAGWRCSRRRCRGSRRAARTTAKGMRRRPCRASGGQAPHPSAAAPAPEARPVRRDGHPWCEDGALVEPGGPMPAHPSRRTWLIVAADVALVVLLAWALFALRGPALPGYEVTAGPLVQDVVATGRVASPSRVEVGAEIAGLVLERRVTDGDRVAPGDVLVVLRARDLEARRDEARAALATLREADRPQAQARLREARAALAQAERNHARRKELGAQQLVSRESV